MMTELDTLVNHISASSNNQVFRPKELRSFADEAGVPTNTVDKLLQRSTKVAYGRYNIYTDGGTTQTGTDQSVQQPTATVSRIQPNNQVQQPMSVSSTRNEEVYVPSKDSNFVRWGNYSDINKIIRSGHFYPTFITGLSGNGKTMMVEQSCAANNREYVRVQITPETDEDDLMGGFRLINGETVFQKGPVVKAMESGAILLIDEIDRGSNKVMCLQGVLEGKPTMIKKTGEVITPADGFNVIATANTKGQGSDDGRFVAATIIDEAFLERFIITIEQDYPTFATERKILNKHMQKFGTDDANFTEMLVTWADTIRKTYNDGGVDETISTRRLCHIAHTYSIFGDRQKAVELCVNRFDEDTRVAFLDLYSKVDASVGNPADPAGDNPGDESGINFEDALNPSN